MATKKTVSIVTPTLEGPDFGATVEAHAAAPVINPFVRSFPWAESMLATRETRTLSQIERDTKKPAISADITGEVLTIEFSHGKTIVLNGSTLNPDIKISAMMHGLKQKLVDAAAIARDLDTGRSASLDDKYRAILEVANRVQGIGEEDGEPSWNKTRAGGPTSSGGTGGLLVRALVEVTGKTKEAVTSWLDGMTKEQRAGFRKDQQIAAVIARMAAEKAPAAVAVDTASLLAGFMNKG